MGKKVGEKFELAGLEWTIVDINEKGYVCLAEKLKKDMRFDSDSNNWQASHLRNYLNTEFYKELAQAAGEGNIIPFERDLLSLDGQTEYGTCEDKVSLITVDEYRKYRKWIPNAGYWWWTITADSTKCNDDDWFVRVVSPRGLICYFGYYDCFGVRPFCIFSSSLFES